MCIVGCQSEINRPEHTVVQGCLSHADAAYAAVTGKSGRQYELSGNNSQIDSHNGHGVLVRGLLIASSQAPGAPIDPTNKRQSVISGYVLFTKILHCKQHARATPVLQDGPVLPWTEVALTRLWPAYSQPG